jgi:signal transduction histidine kinase
MKEKKTVPASQVLADIKYGLSDDELMSKYGLAPKGLQSLFRKLVAGGLITQAELDARASLFDGAFDFVIGTPGDRSDSISEPSTPGGIELPVEKSGSAGDFFNLLREAFPRNALFENPLAMALFLVFLYPVGLFLLWQSARFNVVTKAVVTIVTVIPVIYFVKYLIWLWLLVAVIGGLFLLWKSSARTLLKACATAGAILLVAAAAWMSFSDRKQVPSPQKQVSSISGQGRNDEQPVKGTSQTLSDCEEKEPPFPVQPPKESTPGKELLTTMIRIYAITGAKKLGSESSSQVMRQVLGGHPPRLDALVDHVLESNYNCSAGGISDSMISDTKNELFRILDLIYEEKVAKGLRPEEIERKQAERELKDKWKVPSEKKLEAQFEEGKSAQDRLQRLVGKLGKSEHLVHAKCLVAVNQMIGLVSQTIDQALEERKQYIKALNERAERVERCREKVLAEQRKMQEERLRLARIAEEDRKKREKLELEKTAQELKSGKRKVQSFKDAVLKYDAVDGSEYVEEPPTAVPPDKRYLVLSGTVETKQGDAIICKVDSRFHDDVDFKIRKWAFKAAGTGSYVPRIDRDVKVIGRISSVLHGKTIIGKPIYMIVVDAIAVEEDGGGFYCR